MKSTTPVTRRRATAILVAGGLSAAGLTACKSDGSAAGAASPTTPAAKVTFSPAEGATDVRPDATVTVTASGGTLTEVTLTGADGTTVAGAVAADGTEWASSAPLTAGTQYTVHATAKNSAGTASTHDATLTTLTPQDTAFPAVAPLSGSTVGVGMPIIVTFDSPIDDAQRATVERGLVVTATPAPVAGSWSWSSDSKVEFRPEQYWPANSQVHLAVNLGAVEVSPGVWGKQRAIDFGIGSAMVSTVDIAAHTLTVTRDGQLLRTIPVTLGRSGYDGRFITRSGTKVIMSLEKSREMNSETTGIGQDDPNYYNLDVHYAMRVTNSGEFLHAAPWSVASQGKANVSHGCTGMSTENAAWMFANSKVGDVVVYTGSDRTVETGNGWTVWDETYDQWRAGSALTT